MIDKEYIQVKTDFLDKIILENTCTMCGVLDPTFPSIYGSENYCRICTDCEGKIKRQDKIDEILK